MLRIRKFWRNLRGAASGDLLRKLGFASGNLIASRQAHSDGALWNFRFVVRPYAAARFGRRFDSPHERKRGERRLWRSDRRERCRHIVFRPLIAYRESDLRSKNNFKEL